MFYAPYSLHLYIHLRYIGLFKKTTCGLEILKTWDILPCPPSLPRTHGISGNTPEETQRLQMIGTLMRQNMKVRYRFNLNILSSNAKFGGVFFYI